MYDLGRTLLIFMMCSVMILILMYNRPWTYYDTDSYKSVVFDWETGQNLAILSNLTQCKSIKFYSLFINFYFNFSEHLVLEQVIYAALDCHSYGVATMCIYILSNEFPGSMRVMRHKAALLEAEEKLVLVIFLRF